MKSSKTSTLVTCAVLLLATGLLFGCKPIMDKKPLPPKEESKEVAPAAAPTPAPAPAPAPAPSAAAEPVTKIEEVQSIQSLESIDTAPSTTQVQVADDGDDVVKVTPTIMRKVQQALIDAGFNPGPADGVSGAKTRIAIESFQKQNNLPTGKLTKKTLRVLGVDF